ncbi:2-hydroxychromene-2-carboxylate isomerase [Sphingomonas oligophenolica]|uniref:2-hydroxychromene-2-carboxylate isomerase n=1 Tax=Sphingomonas oligophenolica TaxID=301154 RepID=A0A502BWR2_9SPHN|nr:2-hydroxychromene-2-carboxylate isomerase [Sphingomonas oligophenolica]
MPTLRFYFDYLSPYAYLAHTQLVRLNPAIDYRPFDIRALMPAVGNVPTSVICKPKNRYIQADLRRWVGHYGVPFARNPGILELDHRRLLRATLLVAERGDAGVAVSALFAAMWGVPRPLGTAAEVAEVLVAAGVTGASIAADIDSSDLNEAVTRATDEAVASGVFGAPAIFVGDEMFFGNDRLDFVRAALERSA